MENKFSNILELFTNIVSTWPHNVAIKDCKSQFTYLELYRHACNVAGILCERGVRTGDRVICVSKKDTKSVICFWGILLSGGVPVMLDHEDGVYGNESRMRAVKPSLIIADKENDIPVGFRHIPALDFKDCSAENKSPLSESVIRGVSIPFVCYILLTSGTTGEPKAVQITHGNVLHYTQAIYEKIGRPEKVNAVHASTFAADLGLTNFLVALISGGMLRILNKTEATDPAIFNEIIERDKISLLKITPSHLASLVAGFKEPFKEPVHTIVLGGEKLSWEFVQSIFSSGICANLYNHYGPTEATVGAIAFKIERDYACFGKTGSVPLGSPLGEGKCFIDSLYDDVGELYITGPGISIGYFDNDHENGRKFMVKEVMGENIACYRTGDICRKLEDGNFEFLYRIDRQVKVRGYRIELGEIELAMAAHPAVEQVMVAVSGDQAHTALEAYIKPKDRQLTAATIKNWLLQKLPAYKIPAEIYFYTDAPFNSNGKIDFKALQRACKKQQPMAVFEEEETNDSSWTAVVQSAWKKLLGKNNISANDNFFETGGDSLLAIQLIGKLQRHGYKIHITDLNSHPVLKDFLVIDPVSIMHEKKLLSQVSRNNHFTFSQYRFLTGGHIDVNRYCQVILLETNDKISIREMVLAIRCVVKTHPQLSTAFTVQNGMLLNEADRGRELQVGVSLLDNLQAVAVQVQFINDALLGSIAIDKGELFKAHIFTDPGGKDYLYLACHHLAIDVISWNILIDELLEYYDQLLHGISPVIVPENALDAFFSTVDQQQVTDAAVDNATGSGMLYRLPKQELNIAVTGVGEVSSLAIQEELPPVLNTGDGQHDSATFTGVLLTAFGCSLFSEFPLAVISIDLEFHGRPQGDTIPDLSRSVAWWSTTFPINLEQEKLSVLNCSELIRKKAEYANMVNLQPGKFSRVTEARPDIRFNYLGNFPQQFSNASVSFTPSCLNPGATRDDHALAEYKLFFTVRSVGDLLHIDIQYHANWFSSSCVENIGHRFVEALRQLVNKENSGEAAPMMSFKSNLPSVGQPLYNVAGAGTDLVKWSSPKNIFLTGATGFLGIHLLRELAADKRNRIYCLVRGEDESHARNRIQNCFKHYFNETIPFEREQVRVIKGDLLTSHLGMQADGFSMVANETDTIVHAAADINLLKGYSELVQTNIGAAENIIRLAATGKEKELHYISTLAVSGYTANGSCRNFSEEDFDYGQSFISDYERTKFEAEKLFRDFINREEGGKIYRVGHIAAHSITGRFQRNIEQNRIFQVLKGMMVLKQVPDIYRERISFSYVDIVAKAVALVARHNPVPAMNCFHAENPYYISVISLASMLKKLGYEIDIVDMGVFDQSVSAFRGTVEDKQIVDLMYSWVKRYIDYPRQINYIQRNSLDSISRFGLYFREINLNWLSNMIRDGIKAGYFPLPAGVKTISGIMAEAEIA